MLLISDEMQWRKNIHRFPLCHVNSEILSTGACPKSGPGVKCDMRSDFSCQHLLLTAVFHNVIV